MDFYGRALSSLILRVPYTISTIPFHCPKPSEEICCQTYQPWVRGPLDESSPDCSICIVTIVWNLNLSWVNLNSNFTSWTIWGGHRRAEDTEK